MGAIQIKEPSVKTTTVTVQNVMIGKRQLTQRVFKQIIEEDIFGDEPNSLKGEAWGFVNYDVNDNYKHILWVNKDGELRRCYVHKNNKSNGFEENWYVKTFWDGKINEHAAKYLVEQLPQLFIAV